MLYAPCVWIRLPLFGAGYDWPSNRSLRALISKVPKRISQPERSGKPLQNLKLYDHRAVLFIYS